MRGFGTSLSSADVLYGEDGEGGADDLDFLNGDVGDESLAEYDGFKKPLELINRTEKN